MIKGAVFEIFEIQHPPHYEQSGFSFVVQEKGTELEVCSKNPYFTVSITESVDRLRFLLLYKETEIGQSEIFLPNKENSAGRVQVLKFCSGNNDRKGNTCRNTSKIIQLRVFVKGIYEECTQEYVRCLKSTLNILKERMKTEQYLAKNHDQEKQKSSEASAEIIIERLEVQICEKNKIIQSILQEFNEMRKNSSIVHNENLELRRKLNESTSKTFEFASKRNNSEENLKGAEGKDKEIRILYERIRGLETEYMNVIKGFEERSKDFDLVVGKLTAEKNGYLTKCEELNELVKRQATQIEELLIANTTQKAKIFVQDSVSKIYTSFECHVKQLETIILNEQDKNKKLCSEINELKNLIKEKDLTQLSESSENLNLRKRIAQLQELLDISQSNLLTTQNEKTDITTLILKSEEKIKLKETITKSLEVEKELTTNLTHEIENLLNFNIELVSDLEKLDSDFRTLKTQTSSQQNLILEKDEELESLKEIIFTIQKVPNSSHRQDSIDEQICEFLMKASPKARSGFTQESKGVYTYAGQKIFVKKSDGKVVMGINGVEIPIEEFFEEFTLQEIKKIQAKRLEKLKSLTLRNSKCLCRLKNLSPSSKENLGTNRSFTSSQRISVNKSMKF